MSTDTIPTILTPTTRFSDRVENYIRYCPSYPSEIVNFLETELGLKKDQRIADIGSGTGLFADILLQKGYSVYALSQMLPCVKRPRKSSACTKDSAAAITGLNKLV